MENIKIIIENFKGQKITYIFPPTAQVEILKEIEKIDSCSKDISLNININVSNIDPEIGILMQTEKGGN